MLQTQRERCRSNCEFSPGLSLQGQPRGKFAYWLSSDFRENVGNKDTNVLAVDRLDGMGRQGWKVRSMSVVQLLSVHPLQPSLEPCSPQLPPRASPWTNLVQSEEIDGKGDLQQEHNSGCRSSSEFCHVPSTLKEGQKARGALPKS